MLMLALESSCDETAAALYDTEQGLLSHALHSQAGEHAVYGGVVPELASRDHVRHVVPLIRRVLHESGRELHDLQGVAYTAGPGLSGALLTGAVTGRTLAYALGIPAVAVNHMEGHLLAPLLEEHPPRLPCVALLVSGGHTLLVWAEQEGSYQVLGQSVDDAAGEAFDKTAKLLGLPYPGGPHLERLAQGGRPGCCRLPRPLLQADSCDFSFAGLKTAAALALQRSDRTQQARADLALEFSEAVAEILEAKCARALTQCGCTRLLVAGGVSANTLIRERLRRLMERRGGEAYFARPQFCTDNAAMIARAGAMRLLSGQQAALSIRVRPRWPLDEAAADE